MVYLEVTFGGLNSSASYRCNATFTSLLLNKYTSNFGKVESILASACPCVPPFVKAMVMTLEPRSEKTGLRGFRPGPTQTELYSHRRWLDA